MKNLQLWDLKICILVETPTEVTFFEVPKENLGTYVEVAQALRQGKSGGEALAKLAEKAAKSEFRIENTRMVYKGIPLPQNAGC